LKDKVLDTPDTTCLAWILWDTKTEFTKLKSVYSASNGRLKALTVRAFVTIVEKEST